MIILLFVLCIICTVINWKISVPLYLICALWINDTVTLGSISFMNAIFFFLSALFMVKKGVLSYKTNLDKEVIFYFLYSFAILVPFLLLSTKLSILDQISSQKGTLALLLGLMFYRLKISLEDIQKYKSFLLLPVLGVCLYGIFSYVTHTNYFIELISNYSKIDDIQDIAEATMDDIRGGMTGRIMGVSPYPIQYGILMGIWFYIYRNFFCTNSLLNLIVLILIFVNIYLTGSRGPLMALALSFGLYILLTQKLKRITFYLFLVGLFVFCFASQYLDSFFMLFDQNETKGSSIDMRLLQLTGAFSLISDSLQSILFGNGLGYTQYYISTYGAHPLALFFEGSITSGLPSYGILGLIFIWLMKFILMFNIAYSAYKKQIINKNNFYFLSFYLLMRIICDVMVGGVYGTLYTISFFIMLKVFILRYQKQLKS